MIKDNFIISLNSSIEDAMKTIDKNGQNVVLIVDDKKLIGILTDGDVRRAILKGYTIKDSIADLINYNFKYCTEEEASLARLMMKNQKIRFLPIVNSKMELVELLFEHDKLKFTANLKIPVVINAGGLGTRLYPYTKILPKPLVPVGETPILELIIKNFLDYGCKDFYVIVNYKKNMIKAYFDEIEKDYNIHFIEEKEFLGTGGGLRLVKDIIKGDFIFSNCDIIVNANYCDVLKEHNQNKNLITMICANLAVKIPYGVVNLNKDGTFESFKEKPQYNKITNTGVYFINSSVVDTYVKPNEEVGFPTIFERVHEDNKKVGIYVVSENQWFDMGEQEKLENMTKKLVAKQNKGEKI